MKVLDIPPSEDGVLMGVCWLGENEDEYGVIAMGTAQGTWCAYLGSCRQRSNETALEDAFRISYSGVVLPKEVACAFFPDCDPEKWHA